MSSAIDAALAAAAKAAANAVPTVIEHGETMTTAPVAYAAPGRKLTTEDRIGGAFAVDHYLKFTAGGKIQVGKEVTDLVDTLRVAISLDEIGAGVGLSYEGPGGGLVYVRCVEDPTSPGARCEDGTLFADALKEAKKFKPGIKAYNAWQLPFVALENAGPAKAGDRLGYTTVWSSFKEFILAHDKGKQKYGPNAVLEMELSCKIAKNANNKVFGQAQFRLIGEVEQGE